MCWRKRDIKRDIWKTGPAVAGLLLLLIFMAWIPLSVVGAYEPTQLEHANAAATGAVQATPTVDLTVTALVKDQLNQQDVKLQRDNSFPWTILNAIGISIGTILVATAALIAAGIGFLQWLGNRKDEQKKRDDDRFQAVVTGLGDKKEGARIGAAILLRTFLRKDYKQFYTQTFDLAVANLRLRNKDPNPDHPEPLDSLSQALITAFQESFPRAREYVKREHLSQEPRYLDASKIQLDNANLAKADLKQAWMPNAVLRKAILRGADLSEANLSHVAMSNADLRGAILDRTDFSGSDLSKTDLRAIDLRAAILDETRFISAELREADLRKTDLTKVLTFDGARLDEAKLDEAILNGKNLEAASLKKTHLVAAQLIGARFSWADLSEADLRGANLSEADLRGANLSEAKLMRANLSGADLSPVWTQGGYSETSLEGADLSGADLSGADLSGAVLKGTDLTRANLTNVRRSKTKIWKAHPDALGEPFSFKTNLEDVRSLKDTDLRGVRGLTKEELEACKARGAIIDDDAPTSSSQSTVSPSPPS